MTSFRKANFLLLYILGLSVIGLKVQAQADTCACGLSQLLDRVNTRSAFLTPDSAAVLIKLAQQNATRYNRLPEFKLNAQADLGTNNNLPGGYFSYGIVPGNSRVRNEGNSSTILTDLAIASVNWTIYDFGENNARQQVAASDVQVEQSKFNQSKYQLQALAIDNYLQWQRTEELLSIQLLHIQRNKEIQQSVLVLAKSGIKAGVDTSIAEAEISRLRLNYVELKGQREQYKLMLSAIADLPIQQLQADTNFINHLIAHNQTLPRITDSAMADHPLLNYYHSLYQNSLDKERLVKKSYLPIVSLQGAVWGRGSSVSSRDEFRSLSKGIGLERGNYLVGFGITYDLFDLKRKQVQLKTQEAATDYAQKQLQRQQMLLNLSESKVDAQLVTALERLQEIPHQLSAAQAAYRQQLSLYKNGLTTILELNTALGVLYRAETDFIKAKYMYCQSLFEKAITGNQVPALLQFTN
ncbi:transporter [Niastella yeongjuensis]|uniref:Transporter n=2 Tax=Niastella yeongjuensis TaxID=354355 RepID=A0A1V9EAT0_9BACT|nr:transporter [Niastella yeongjuensis]